MYYFRQCMVWLADTAARTEVLTRLSTECEFQKIKIKLAAISWNMSLRHRYAFPLVIDNGIREGSKLNVTNASVWSLATIRAHIRCLLWTSLLTVIGTLNGKSYCMCFFFLSDAHVFARMAAILHIEIFVTFDWDPSLISRLITDSD